MVNIPPAHLRIAEPLSCSIGLDVEQLRVWIDENSRRDPSNQHIYGPKEWESIDMLNKKNIDLYLNYNNRNLRFLTTRRAELEARRINPFPGLTRNQTILYINEWQRIYRLNITKLHTLNYQHGRA